MVALVIVLAALAFGGEPAAASFPGSNGKIAFVEWGVESQNICTVDANGSGKHCPVFGPIPGYVPYGPAWSPDGTKLAYAKFHDCVSVPYCESDIHIVGADGSGETVIELRGSDSEPAWSPDGKRIAFTSHRDSDGELDGEIYAMKPDGSAITKLTDNEAEDREPAWSPDGTMIALSSNRDGDYEIYTMNAAGSAQVNRSHSPLILDVSPSWSPEGHSLAFASVRTTPTHCPPPCTADIHVMNANGTGRLVLTSSPAHEADPVWSPDGTKIAFTCDEDICTMNPTGQEQRLLIDAPTDVWFFTPDWQPVQPGYARPRAATPSRVPLVPAFARCEAPNAIHGAPLTTPSCSSPVPGSDYLTVGTPDANGKAAGSIGVVKVAVAGESPVDTFNGDQADVQVDVSVTDVRKRGDLSDYTGELEVILALRVTDRQNGPAENQPATATDFSFPIPTSCTATPGTEAGAECHALTSVDTITPGVAREGQRAIWELEQIQVFDGGADGDIDTSDNTLFAVQGLFEP